MAWAYSLLSASFRDILFDVISSRDDVERAIVQHEYPYRDGAEVDFIIERAGALTPVEVKWTENPTLGDARHLLTFLQEKKQEAKHGYVICRCPRPLQLHDHITALPWFLL